jgi:hypothetical protein
LGKKVHLKQRLFFNHPHPQECRAEVGRLLHRATELREEIEWAQHQLEATHYQGITWERLVMSKQAIAGEGGGGVKESVMQAITVEGKGERLRGRGEPEGGHRG